MKTFGQIRLEALDKWYQGLSRSRTKEDLSDTYSESKWCEYQTGNHISFICSINDWFDNVSDLLQDQRFDLCTEAIPDEDVLFRYYTRILLCISEILEDFIMFNLLLQSLDPRNDKGKSGNDLERDVLLNGELLNISNFINSVCKHKAEKKNLHKHHHMKVEFKDLGANSNSNQIDLETLKWNSANENTTILMPNLIYFIEVLIKVNNNLLNYIETRGGYKEKMIELFSKR